jgi:hypothetical protein
LVTKLWFCVFQKHGKRIQDLNARLHIVSKTTAVKSKDARSHVRKKLKSSEFSLTDHNTFSRAKTQDDSNIPASVFWLTAMRHRAPPNSTIQSSKSTTPTTKLVISEELLRFLQPDSNETDAPERPA